MEHCIYCGANIQDSKKMAKAHTRSFAVCSDGCKHKAELYVQKNKKRKMILYMAMTVAAVLILIAAILERSMLPAYCGQIIAGIAFMLFPYPITRFDTFRNYSIKSVTRISRIIGVVLATTGLLFFLLT